MSIGIANDGRLSALFLAREKKDVGLAYMRSIVLKLNGDIFFSKYNIHA